MGLTNWNKQKEKSNRWWTQGYSFGIRKVEEVSMVSFIFLFVLFMVLVLSVNSYWDGTKKLCEECIWIISDFCT